MTNRLSRIVLVFVAVVVIFSFSAVNTYAIDKIDLSDVSSGRVDINYELSDKKIMVMVQQDETKYYYQLTDNSMSVPLQLGNGEYKIGIYENISGNRYKAVLTEKTTVETTIEDVFTNSIQNINFNEDMIAIKFANHLVKDAKTDEAKVAAFYKFMVENIKYDYDKANSVQSGYVPNIEDTIISLDGICYDYASLFAAMARSQGIPTKLVKGYNVDVDSYHAWNQVYLNGEWITVDTTFDSVTGDRNMVENAEDYEVVKVY
jgi:transglutaminase-like putative cysteine protease